MRRYLISFGFLIIVLISLVFLYGCASSPPKMEKVVKDCLDCHDEYRTLTTENNVHAPLQQGSCRACHRNHGLIGEVYLKADKTRLCLPCHRNIQENTEIPVVHQPVAQGQCLECHQPHNSINPALLSATSPQLCFACHDQTIFTRNVRHQPVETGCDSCHATHGAEEPFLLKVPADQQCLSCHDQPDQLQTQHAGYPLSSRCNDCHLVHSSQADHLLRDFVHNPVKQGQCSDCHNNPDDSEPFALKQAAVQLCRNCHETPHPDTGNSQQHATQRIDRRIEWCIDREDSPDTQPQKEGVNKFVSYEPLRQKLEISASSHRILRA